MEPRPRGVSDEVCFETFARHCRAFYDSSLLLRRSSYSSSSMHEEKKTDENTTDANDSYKQAAAGKVVLETLDRISIICSTAITDSTQHPPHRQKEKVQESVASLRQEHSFIIECHHDLLLECGLLVVDQFVDSSFKQNDCLLQKYVQIRDDVRRRAHKAAMLHRQMSFVELLHESIKNVTDLSESSKPRLAQLKNVEHTLSTIQAFVGKYETNIGSHSFLAGLYRIVHLQINSKAGMQRGVKHPSHIVRWKFCASVLTEACRPCHVKDNEDDDDELAYAREAIQVLLSFLIWIRDVDLEGGGLIISVEGNDSEFDPVIFSSHQSNNSTLKEKSESIISFEVDKFVSNQTLRRILAVLPNPRHLDARATGSVVEVDPSNTVSRKNIGGHDDEQRPWFARLETCVLL